MNNRTRRLNLRLVEIEDLYQANKITENQLDILDSIARVEAGILNFNEAKEEFLRE